MKNSLSENRLAQLSDFVTARMGLYFPRERWGTLERHTKAAALEFGFSDAETFIQWLITSPLHQEHVEMLANHLTIGETYFWREPLVFEVLGEQILPELIRARAGDERRLRIWSAGCATGEEPYSIAIALRRALPAPKDWHITLLATDINPRILQRARAGIYGKWSFRNAPAWLTGRYFTRQGDKLEILPEIRTMVTFAYLNLAEDPYPSPLNNTNAMDLIFCRNVLMYFTPERARQVARNLYHSLVEGGWLMVGASELSQTTFSQFVPVNFPGAIIYRKARQAARPVEGLRPAVTAPPNVQIEPAPDKVRPAAAPPPSPQRKAERAPDGESATAQSAYAQALALYAQGFYTEVVRQLEGAETPGERALVVRALANLGQLTPALAACEQALAIDKLDPGLHYLCATILQEQNRESEAMAALRRALYLDPNFVLAHFALGNLAQRQGKTVAAKKSFENVLALLNAYNPQDTLPEAEGLTASRLEEIVRATFPTETLGAST